MLRSIKIKVETFFSILYSLVKKAKIFFIFVINSNSEIIFHHQIILKSTTITVKYTLLDTIVNYRTLIIDETEKRKLGSSRKSYEIIVVVLRIIEI